MVQNQDNIRKCHLHVYIKMSHGEQYILKTFFCAHLPLHSGVIFVQRIEKIENKHEMLLR